MVEVREEGLFVALLEKKIRHPSMMLPNTTVVDFMELGWCTNRRSHLRRCASSEKLWLWVRARARARVRVRIKGVLRPETPGPDG
jgi:hypothetical protein